MAGGWRRGRGRLRARAPGRRSCARRRVWTSKSAAARAAGPALKKGQRRSAEMDSRGRGSRVQRRRSSAAATGAVRARGRPSENSKTGGAAGAVMGWDAGARIWAKMRSMALRRSARAGTTTAMRQVGSASRWSRHQRAADWSSAGSSGAVTRWRVEGWVVWRRSLRGSRRGRSGRARSPSAGGRWSKSTRVTPESGRGRVPSVRAWARASGRRPAGR